MAASSTARNAPSNPLLGIGCMAFGGLLMTGNNAILKWLTTGYPVGEIIFIRGIFFWFPIAYFIARSGGLLSIRITRLQLHAVRAGCIIFSAFIYIFGLRYLPLADVTAIGFSTPLFVTALATFLLGEVVGWRRWSAVVVGFIGILIITRPTSGLVSLAVLFPIGSAVWTSIRDLVTRRMVTTESSNGILITSSAAVMLAGLCTAPFGWVMPTSQDFGLMACSGLFSAFGHYFMIEAFRNAEAVIVSPFRYLTIVWATTLGYVVWGDLPDKHVIAGVIIVICSGLYILHREIVVRRRRLQQEQQAKG